MKNELSIGSISEGTLKTEDIGNNLIWHLNQINLETSDLDTYRKLKHEFSDEIEELEESAFLPGEESEDEYSETLEHVYDEIKAIADNYLPDYCYLGFTIGDGADFGVWPEPQLLEDTTQGSFDGYVYRSTIETNGVDEHVPAEYSHYLAVNDHGNATLWARNGDTWRECWAVV